MDNQELIHYGVPGMKWGVRKSTPTSGGKGGKRKSASKADIKDKVLSLLKKTKTNKSNDPKKPVTAKPVPTKTELKKRKLSEVPDDELKAKINRLELEKRYKDLATAVNPPKSTRGKDFTLRVIEKIGENTLVNIGTQAANKGLGVAINKAFNVDSYDTEKRIVNPNKGQSDKK